MTAPLGDALVPYSTPEAYPQAFAHNVAVLDAAGARPAVAALLERLAAATRVPQDVLATDLKRHVAVAHEYYPDLLRDRPGIGPAAPAAVRAAALRGAAAGAPRVQRAAVLVDAWEPGALEGFYGRPLLDAFARDAAVAALPVSPAIAAHTPDALRLLASWPGVARAARRAAAAERVGFGRFLLRVSRSVLLGRALRRRIGPRVLVSGNDNGASLVTARAAGARLVLLQNGMRGLLADSAFVGADAYVAMVADDLLDVRARTGCRLGEAVPAGSLRLHAHLRARPDAPATAHDVLFVSSLEPDPAAFDARHGHYYAMRHEQAAIAEVAAFAARSGASVALYPRHDGEAAQHAALGLELGPVTRLERSPGGVYEAIRAARLVLSTCSTASLEAMAQGVPAGYVNLSGNAGLNPVAAEQGLEWTGAEPFGDFVARLTAEGRPARSVVQRDDLVEVVRATVARQLA